MNDIRIQTCYSLPGPVLVRFCSERHMAAFLLSWDLSVLRIRALPGQCPPRREIRTALQGETGPVFHITSAKLAGAPIKMGTAPAQDKPPFRLGGYGPLLQRNGGNPCLQILRQPGISPVRHFPQQALPAVRVWPFRHAGSVPLRCSGASADGSRHCPSSDP